MERPGTLASTVIWILAEKATPWHALAHKALSRAPEPLLRASVFRTSVWTVPVLPSFWICEAQLDTRARVFAMPSRGVSTAGCQCHGYLLPFPPHEALRCRTPPGCIRSICSTTCLHVRGPSACGRCIVIRDTRP